jgi:hypothetical protein
MSKLHGAQGKIDSTPRNSKEESPHIVRCGDRGKDFAQTVRITRGADQRRATRISLVTARREGEQHRDIVLMSEKERAVGTYEHRDNRQKTHKRRERSHHSSGVWPIKQAGPHDYAATLFGHLLGQQLGSSVQRAGGTRGADGRDVDKPFDRRNGRSREETLGPAHIDLLDVRPCSLPEIPGAVDQHVDTLKAIRPDRFSQPKWGVLYSCQTCWSPAKADDLPAVVEQARGHLAAEISAHAGDGGARSGASIRHRQRC